MNILECSLKTEQAARLAGVKMGTTQYWVSTGLITPHKPPQGSGTSTGWAFLDIIRLRVISRLRNGGISLQKIRKALKRLGEWGEADPLGSGAVSYTHLDVYKRQLYSPASVNKYLCALRGDVYKRQEYNISGRPEI